MQIEEARELIEKWPLGFKDWPDGTGEMMKEFTSQLLQAQSLISREEERLRCAEITDNQQKNILNNWSAKNKKRAVKDGFTLIQQQILNPDQD